MNVADYYQALADKRAGIMAECIADEQTFAMHVTSHNVLKDFELMLQAINGPERAIFMQACREYQYSLEAVMYGHYRHAFSSLRLALELFTATIYFSANQMKMRLWLQGHADLWWKNMTDKDSGVFSSDFIRAFNPSLDQYRAQYMGLMATVYRECSEYVHGNPITHENLSVMISYDAERAQDYHEKVSTIRLCVLFQFLSRYLSELSSESKNMIEPLVLEAFGNLPEIQASFGALGS